MAGSFVATSRRLVLPRAGCKIPSIPKHPARPLFADSITRLAFVEYEDRRDADDAYHDMHNKRIGRDDILKIEVSQLPYAATFAQASMH